MVNRARKTVSYTVPLEVDERNISFVIAELQKLKREFPDAIVESFNETNGYGHTIEQGIRLRCYRQEDDIEYNARITQEEKRLAERVAREINDYERLRKVYGK